MRKAGKATVMLPDPECLRYTGISEELVCHVDPDLPGEETGAYRLGAILQPCLDREGLRRIPID